MSTYDGEMTELKRVEAEGITAVVSYYTNGEGKRFEPRLRFVVGERDRPVKGLTQQQAFAVRDAFNHICDEWGKKRTGKAIPTGRVAKSKPKRKAKTVEAIDMEAVAEAMAAMVAAGSAN